MALRSHFIEEKEASMRIQETDRILKESRYARHTHTIHESEEGVMNRVWRALSGLTRLFR